MVKKIPNPKFSTAWLDWEPATFEETCKGNDPSSFGSLLIGNDTINIAFFNWATLYIPHMDITMQLWSDEDWDETVYLMRWEREITTTWYSNTEDSQQSLDSAVEDLERVGYKIIRI